MDFNEYRALDATALARAIAADELDASEALDAAHRRLLAVNPGINAVVLDLFAKARQQIEVGLPEGPLRGVPFLVKDMDGELAGERCAMGSRSLLSYIPAHDSNLFARYRAAGLVFLGKTNCPEFGIMGTTEPELWGPARNPWNLDHSTGGSSGGSAAAVAAGIVPVAHAGDGGGSIRIPAANCGLFGLKPSRGRMPLGPGMGEGWNGYVVPHVVSRSVRDSAAFLQATRGADVGAPYAEPPGSPDFTLAVSEPVAPLRIGFSTKALLGTEMSPECIRAVEDTAALLNDLGHEVFEVDLPIEPEEAAEAYLTVVAAGIATMVAQTQHLTGRSPHRGDFEDPTWFLAHIGRVLSSYDLERARAYGFGLTRALADMFEGFDVHLTSTLAFPPVELGELALSTVERMSLQTLSRVSSVTGPLTDPVYRQALKQLAGESLSRSPNTQPFNMTGRPAMSVPLHWTDQGLPVGVQFAGRFGAEGTLLQLATQLEEAKPWFDRHPPL